MVTSDVRPEMEIWPLCACAVKIRNITLVIGILLSLCTKCAVAMRQISRSTVYVSSLMKTQQKAPSNRPNFAIYNEIGVKESNADVRFFLPERPS